ncbi:MAG: LysR family transcriptional activator of nhaA [Myxococcota bacterium]
MRERDLNYQHLRYFRAVAHEGSVQRAARQLHLAPSTVSGQIKALEADLGSPLLERAGRGVVVTNFGRQILAHADAIFAAGQDVVRVASGESRRDVHIGVSSVLPKLLVREIVTASCGDDVTLVLHSGTADNLLGELVARRVDAVLSDGPTPSWVTASTHDYERVSSGIAVFGAESFAETIGNELPVGLNRVPWIVPPKGTVLRSALESWWEENGLAPAISVVVDDSAVMKALGDAAVGIFAAPATMKDAILESYRVVCIGTTEDVRERAFVITRDSNPTDPAIRALWGPEVVASESD